ncbi:MAG TPA: hypothetical protein ACHBX0_04750 [Arsenophonus sp.]
MAIFYNSTTFYAQVRGERIATLESATFSTMISVIPCLSPAGDEIEMVINLEDGVEKKAKGSETEKIDALPVINRTHISTVARVAGGYPWLGGLFAITVRPIKKWCVFLCCNPVWLRAKLC